MLIAIACAILLIVAFSFFSGGNLNLEIRSRGNFLSVRNIGTEPIEITDVRINDRIECSTLSPWLTKELGMDAKYGVEDMHRFWVAGLNANNHYQYLSDKDDLRQSMQRSLAGPLEFPRRIYPDVKSLEPRRIAVGDTVGWQSQCASIVRVTIKTDRGSGTYSFAD